MAKLGWGEVCWGSCLDSPASRLDDTSDGIRSSSNHRTYVIIENRTERMSSHYLIMRHCTMSEWIVLLFVCTVDQLESEVHTENK